MQRAPVKGSRSGAMSHKKVLLGHGSGGKLMHELIEQIFAPELLGSCRTQLNDSALMEINGSRLAVTTDSYVVDPLFFPGGDIGKLAVNGTVNDLSMVGGRPLALTAAFILEEGFPMEDLLKIVASMKEACEMAGVNIITGDTKVVNRGKCDKSFINTTGVGIVEPGVDISADRARPGDLVLVNGDIAAHGMAILSARQELDFEVPIYSDTQPLHLLVADMLSASEQIHCLRDATRGGLASALNELAIASAVGIRIYEDQLAIQDEVKGCCEILGLDPLHVANEGKLLSIVAAEDAPTVLAAMRANKAGRQASIIGEVVEAQAQRPLVVMKTTVGGWRIVDMLAGEQLPRIC